MKNQQCVDRLNLRVNPDDNQSYVPVGAPSLISQREWIGLAYLPDGSGNITEVVYADSGDGKFTIGISVYPARSLPGEPYEAGVIDFRPVGAVSTGDDGLIVADNRRYVALEPDEAGIYRVSISKGLYPELLFEINSRFTARRGIDSMKLKGEYDSHSSVLVPADAKLVGDKISEAYAALSQEQLAEGNLIQPVFVKYRLEDAAGCRLFESTPLMVCSDQADLRPEDVVIEFDTSSSTSPAVVTAPGYSLHLRMPRVDDRYLCRKVARLVVAMTPQLHFADFSLDPLARIYAPIGGRLKMDVSLPGCGGSAVSYVDRIFNALKASDSLYSDVLTVDNPFVPDADGRIIKP